MRFSMNIEQANAIALPEILQKISCAPVKQVRDEIWFNSPFRDEKTASFHVNSVKNVWYDFGATKGGDVVRFAIEYLLSQNEDHTVVDALRWLRNMTIAPSAEFYSRPKGKTERTSKILVQKVLNIKNEGLLQYLEARRIPLEVANLYLKEAVLLNDNTGKQFNTLCIENEGEGYELRNKFFKGCTGPKSISFIRGAKVPVDEIHVFEGVFDFLSAVQNEPDFKFQGDVMILNSVACLPQGIPYIRDYFYRTINSWLDNDEAGESAKQTLKEVANLAGCTFKPMNEKYAPFKDVNAWHIEKMSAAQKKVNAKLKAKEQKNVKA